MMISRNLRLFGVIVSILLVILLVLRSAHPYILINNEKIMLEVADEIQEMQKGLMFREELCVNCGMIFVFEQDLMHSFWMKNTLIPLDMVFIDSTGIVVDVLHADPCEADPCEHFRPQKEAKYVLEVNKNTFNENLIGTNVKIRI